MNYKKHYTLLIEKAKNRKLDGYTEKHHIIPRCIGGDNNKENLVELTPEEHYVAHQLLLKIYPDNHGLIYAAVMMATIKHGSTQRNNKLYGWLRRKCANAMSLEKKGKYTGKENSQYGTTWISNLITKECKKINVDELDIHLSAGWIKKRVINWDNYDENGNHKKKCKQCGSMFIPNKHEKFCSDKCKTHKLKNVESYNKKYYNDLFIAYLESDYVSLNSFCKNEHDKSLVSLTRNFKKYVDVYSEISYQGGQYIKDILKENYLGIKK